MHVLSLPPAFVLSQDQTLMLRMIYGFTSRSESTRTSCLLLTVRLACPFRSRSRGSRTANRSGSLRTASPGPVDAKHRRKVSGPNRKSQTSLINVTAMSLVGPAFRPVREHTPPTFLFPNIQLSKNRRQNHQGGKPSRQRSQSPKAVPDAFQKVAKAASKKNPRRPI